MAEETKEQVKQENLTQQPEAKTPATPEQPPSAPAHHVKIPVSVMKKWGMIIGGVIVVLLLVCIVYHFEKKNPMSKPTLVPIKEQENVSAVSEVPNLSFTIVNVTELKKYLAQHAVSNQVHVKNFSRTPGEFVIVKNMIFKLVSTDQPYFKILDTSGKSEFSYGQSYDAVTQTMTVALYINPIYMDKWFKNDDELTKFVSRAMAGFIYRMTFGKQATSPTIAKQELANMVKYSADIEKYNQIFAVKKK